MKKQVTVMLEVAITIEVDVQEDETTQEAVESITQDMDYQFTECEQANGTIVSTEIIGETIGAVTNI